MTTRVRTTRLTHTYTHSHTNSYTHNLTTDGYHGVQLIGHTSITGDDYSAMATTPVYDLVLAVRKRRMPYLGHALRMYPDRIVRCSSIFLVKGGTYYPESSLGLVTDCEGDYLHELIETATNRSAWCAKLASLR